MTAAHGPFELGASVEVFIRARGERDSGRCCARVRGAAIGIAWCWLASL